MKNAVRVALSTAALSVALASAGASTARGQVFFQGNFPVPHGRVSIGFGTPGFAIGAFVPAPYVGRIYDRPSYGYGFSYGEGWVPVQRYRDRWIITEHPDSHRDRSDRRGDERRYGRYDRHYGNRYDGYDRRNNSYRDHDPRWNREGDWR